MKQKHPTKTVRRHLQKWFPLMLITTLLLVLPHPASAHGGDGGQPAAIAGTLAWGFLGFGGIVIALVALVLISGKSRTRASAESFAELTGFSGYIAKMRLFSRNARLFIVHVVGMDVIYGTWSVLFNLYLLGVGFDITFIGLRILLASISRAAASIPAGIISDRIGRKLSFILGDGIGAAMSLIAITTINPTLLLITAVIGGMFGALHGVAEPAFMAENSENYERVHLFSISGGTRTAAMIIGSALAGLVPMLFGGSGAAAPVELYRTIAYVGIGGWFASLIPAIMLTQISAPTPVDRASPTGIKKLFANIRNPDRIWKLTSPEVLIALGAGFALPLMNVFFQSGVGSEEVEIGAVFSAGQAFLVVASFLAPLLANRLGKVRSVVFTRMASIPFILMLAFSTDLGGQVGSVLSIAGLAYIGRITFMNMASPVRAAFAMEILDPEERGTQVGIEQALSSAVSGLTSYLGAALMSAGNFQLPFIMMAAFYLAASFMFWRFFDGREQELVFQPAG